MDLKRVEQLMRARDLGIPSDPYHHDLRIMELADEVPGLVEELRRLNLQIGELQKDLAHWKDCHGVTADKLEESNRLNGVYAHLFNVAKEVVESMAKADKTSPPGRIECGSVRFMDLQTAVSCVERSLAEKRCCCSHLVGDNAKCPVHP